MLGGDNMSSFEQHYLKACYDQDTKDKAALRRSTNRHMTREQRRREARRTMAFLSAVCMAILAGMMILAVLAAPAAGADLLDDGSLPGDDTPALVRCAMTPEEVEQAENEMIEAALLARATRLDDVLVTHYDCCLECCGKNDGITASGLRATPGVTVAVDKDVIPLGADILVDYGDGEIHYMRADDTGSGIKGNHIDVCLAIHEEAVQAGVKTATVWWVMPE